MCRPALLLLTALSLPAMAASGSWSDTQRGVTLQNRGVMMSSGALAPPASAPVRSQNAPTITTISWKYQLLGARPAGLQVKLCNTVNHCVNLDADSGVTQSFYGQTAIAPLRLVYFVPGGGAMNTPLRVISNEVIVNYK
ncbi:flagellar protein FlhE [Rahnella sp. BIGb0236]|uniref:flagellar protein FlhE n=1 Tax=Rahnella TaxID=34037 RepID=UPI000BB1A48F|nr:MULTISPECIES: flagellar protein FlhE [Rahnella]PBI79420.1 flagellar protein FlhE [Rahnella victoriana]PKB89585.1 flagellar protein FlhE [Ewingella americana]TDS84334.1 flagellar protein FlhE [Rahnella sp. BIGb0236]VTQ52787.1 Flagellar protein flhE precursor [Campylobacter jejuni]